MAIVGTASDTDWFAMADREFTPYPNCNTFFEAFDKVYGGAISSVPTTATAFAQRNAFLVFQLYASSNDHLPPFPNDGISFVDGMLASIERNPQGAYSNYIDPTLTKADTERLYWGSNVQRLQKIKAALDPTDVFRFSQGF
jgi:FAD/FMN-containing dehydrogenase